ncbi:hypothetical protein ACFLSQ_07110 [Bacteroidota bacterium]
MYLNYQQIEYAIQEEKDLNYFFIGIIWKRGLIHGVLFIFILNIIIAYIRSEVFEFDQIQYLLYPPLISYFIAAILVFICEVILLSDFKNLNKEQKHKKIKMIYLLAGGLSFFGAIGGLEYDVNFYNSLGFVIELGISFVISMFVGWLFGSKAYEKVKAEIDRKELLENI